MAERKTLNVNGRSRTITVDDPDMPLLYALRDNLVSNGPLFGCGLAQCGACTVHVDGKAVRSCVMPLSKVRPEQKVVTIEGLGRGNRLHPVQRAFIEEQAVQCGYCINGMIMESAAFLAEQQEARPRRRSRRRSPTTSAAAAPMPASCARSSAPPAQREGGNHDQAFQSSRAATCSRAAARSSSASRSPAADTALAAAAAAAAAAGDHRGRCVPRHRCARPGHGLFRQGRSRHRRAHRAARRCAPRSSTCRSTSVSVVEGDTALTPDQGKTWGSLTIQLGGMQIRNAAATARAALLEQAAKRLGAKPEELSVANGVDPRRQPARQLWRADRRQDVRAQARPRQAGEVQGSEGLQDRRQAGAARRYPGQGDRRASPTSTTSACAACCMAAWSGRRRSAPSSKASTKARSRTSPASCGWCARAISSAWWRDSEWGAIKAARQLKATLVEMGRAAGAGQALRACARDQGRSATRPPAMSATPPRRWAQEGVKKLAATYDFAIHTHGSTGPSCAVAEFRDGKLTSWSASQATHDLRKQLAEMFEHAGRRRPLHLSRRLRLLRPQRPRGCGRRRGACSPRRSAGRCGCSGRAPTSTAGTRRGRRR